MVTITRPGMSNADTSKHKADTNEPKTTGPRRRRMLVGVSLMAALSLSACSLPLPVAQPTPKASASSAPEPSTEPSAEATAEVSASPDPTESLDATPGNAGPYGQFTSLSEACLSVSATMLSVAILPLAALVGGSPEDIETAKQELSQMQGKVPEELKPSFEKLRAFTEEAGSDFSKYGDPEFEELMKPIQDWMDKNCK